MIQGSDIVSNYGIILYYFRDKISNF